MPYQIHQKTKKVYSALEQEFYNTYGFYGWAGALDQFKKNRHAKVTWSREEEREIKAPFNSKVWVRGGKRL